MTEASRRLRTAREQAGLTIEELSARTRIRAAYLRAIERGEFEQLPGEFFTRAFLRTCARELRLDPDTVVAEYDTSRGTAAAAIHPAASPPSPATPAAGPPWPEPGTDRVWLPQGAWPVAALAALVLLVVIVANTSTPDQPREPGAVATSGVVEAAAQVAEQPAADPVAETLRLEIVPTDVIWIAATADGERVVYRLVPQGERVVVEGRDELAFRIGNAGAFGYTINGTAGRSLGGPGEVVEFRITRDNYRSFRQ